MIGQYIMQTQKILSEIFQNEPVRWGLRGDPFLWREMKTTLEDHEYPETEEQLTRLLEQTYQQLTGASLSSREPKFVERHCSIRVFTNQNINNYQISPAHQLNTQDWDDHQPTQLLGGKFVVVISAVIVSQANNITTDSNQVRLRSNVYGRNGILAAHKAR